MILTRGRATLTGEDGAESIVVDYVVTSQGRPGRAAFRGYLQYSGPGPLKNGQYRMRLQEGPEIAVQLVNAEMRRGKWHADFFAEDPTAVT